MKGDGKRLPFRLPSWAATDFRPLGLPHGLHRASMPDQADQGGAVVDEEVGDGGGAAEVGAKLKTRLDEGTDELDNG